MVGGMAVRMAAPIVRLDCSHGSTLAVCDCGWRCLAVTQAGARRAADAHRRDVHRHQQQTTESKRRQRAQGARS